MTDPSNYHYPPARGEDDEPCSYEITGDPAADCSCGTCRYERGMTADDDPYYGEDAPGTPCQDCRGTCVQRGTDDPCPACFGEGYIPEQMFIQIRVYDDAGTGEV